MIRFDSARLSLFTFVSIFMLCIAAMGQAPIPAGQDSSAKQGPTKDTYQDLSGVVIPPEPAVVKRNPNSVAIPALPNRTNSDQEDFERPVKPQFEERPAVATTATVGSRFGYRRDPFTRRAKFHSGLDIKAKWGDPVGASREGTIKFVGWYHGYGNMIIVEHGGGVATHYAHLSSFAAEVGQKVERGAVIGYAGSTGRATSPHLHYEVRIDGNAINPLQQIALDPDSAYFKSNQPSKSEAGKPMDSKPAAAHIEPKPESAKPEVETRPRRVSGATPGLQ
ncbi:MAG: hypothetical protein DMF61_18035 [Blastocatellia bacterium AA13]|nr:MAG: hypothetical protein DMF61_18035 [Blastocatellia bacterium AA13]